MAAKTVAVVLDDAKLREIIQATEGGVRRRVIHDGVEYGIFQEFTERGHPSLIPAFENHTKNLGRAIGQAVEQGGNLDDLIGKVAFDIQRDWAADVNVDTGAYKGSIKVDTE